jgi:hypothetical protein
MVQLNTATLHPHLNVMLKSNILSNESSFFPRETDNQHSKLTGDFI